MGLKILFCSAEVAPFAKVGGLADVAGSLPKALAAMGHEVRLWMPGYDMVLRDPKWKASTLATDLRVPINQWWIKRASVHEIRHGGLDVWLASTDEWFDATRTSATIYGHPAEAYLFLARAAMAWCEQSDWMPDVVHCHDWQTGFLPVLMHEQGGEAWRRTGRLFTIHNLAYQGEFDIDVLDKVGLSRELFNYHAVEAHGAVNFLKSGCVFSDHVNTVSETYAREIQTSIYGCRLDGLMRFLAEEGRLSGILNGIDTDEWNPATDLRIAANYDADHPEAKAKCREALLRTLGLEPIPGAPLAGIVSRLSEQKGMHLILEAADRLFGLPIQLVVQGLGDPWLADQFEALQRRYPQHVRFAPRFDVDLAQQIYSGCDMFLMPSAFEPCGLGQLFALRYGTVPIVRKTGGLADTVHEGVNGFVFGDLDAGAFLAAVERAKALYDEPDAWRVLRARGMREDHSWARSAQAYDQLYRRIVASKLSQAIAS